MLRIIRNFPPEMMPSMAVDLLRGNRLELPWLAGKVVVLGREVGVPTPTFDVMYAALKRYVNGREIDANHRGSVSGASAGAGQLVFVWLADVVLSI
jgi:ketopantoate reductase